MPSRGDAGAGGGVSVSQDHGPRPASRRAAATACPSALVAGTCSAVRRRRRRRHGEVAARVPATSERRGCVDDFAPEPTASMTSSWAGSRSPHTALGAGDPVCGTGEHRCRRASQGILVAGNGRLSRRRVREHSGRRRSPPTWGLSGVDEGSDDEPLVDLEAGQVPLASQGADAGRGRARRESCGGQGGAGDHRYRWCTGSGAGAGRPG